MELTLLLLLPPLMLMRTVPGHGELRARDPDVEELEMPGNSGRREWMSGTAGSHHFPISHHSIAGPLRPPGPENPHQPARTGNWCAFVQRHMVSTVVLCGTEPYTVKAVNPCPNGDPDCQVSTYQLSSRPVYRMKQRIFTALHWKCCPGHGGHNCQETVNAGESQSSQDHTETSQTDVSGVDASGGSIDTDLLEDAGWENSLAQQSTKDTVTKPAGTESATHPSASLPFLDSSSLLTAHQIFAVLMAQLRPVLDGFNRTLEHLSSEVEELSRDLVKLRNREDKHVSKSRQANTGTFEEKLEDSFVHIHQIKEHLDFQQKQIQKQMQSQKELLQYNLTVLKEEIDLHINESRDDVQESLRSLSESLDELRQKNLEEVFQREKTLPDRQDADQAAIASNMWQAISSLEKKVLNNTMQLKTLSKNSRHVTNSAHNLDQGLQNLSQRLELISQNTDVYFAETGMEVEAAKVTTLNSVNEMAANLSTQERKLREIELDLENIYQHLQRNNPTSAEETCSCKEISNLLVRLEAEVANVTDLAKENQYALEDAEAKRGQDQWMTEVEDLHRGLLNVKESLAFEQAQSRTLSNHVSQLKASLMGSQQEITGLKERVEGKEGDIQRLSSSFTSLLKDAIRHSEVLEVLLGDEVIEFSSWSDNQQKEMALPVLLQRIRLMQEKIDSHERSLTSQKRISAEKDRMTGDDPVAFSEWSLTKEPGTSAEDHQHSLPDPSAGDDDGDYSVSDFWSLGREVEELADRLSRLEERQCNCTESPSVSAMQLPGEVASLRQALGDHLRTFQNLFSHTDELVSSSRSLNLDQLWTMMRRKDKKRTKEEDMGGIRRKRNTATGSSVTSNSPVAFITGLHGDRMRKRGKLFFEKVALNHGNAYSPSSGAFRAPQTGLYLFLVTLAFEKGPSLAQLLHGTDPVASFRWEEAEGGTLSQTLLLELQREEKVTLEVIKGSLHQEQPFNTFAGILLFSTEDRL